MIRNDIKRCEIFSEFSEEEQNSYFSFTGNKVVHNIDSYYYNIFLTGDSCVKPCDGIVSFVDTLTSLKLDCKETKKLEVPFNDDFTFRPFHFSVYDFRITKENMFDIFVGSYLPNDHTPRIQVQLRSIGLWLNGCLSLIQESYMAVIAILNEYGIMVDKCQENRIDYAYHTNIIQNTKQFFSDSKMEKHLKTTFKIYQKVGNIGREVGVDYLALGQRKSNNTFFRAYNKSKEVVEQNYKGFFADYWLSKGLISSYDKFCLEYAYKSKSFNGLIIGRCEWYLANGNSDSLKDKIRELLKSCTQNSDNYDFLEKSIKNLLPAVTQVTNIEFQTKRKFYHTMENFIDGLECSLPMSHKLYRLYQVVENRKPFLDYLTSKTVAFKNDENYCSWWKRIRSVRVDGAYEPLEREYLRNLDASKVQKTAMTAIASHSVYLNDVNNNTFTQDVSDFLSRLNDNDIKDVSNGCDYLITSTGEVIFYNQDNYNKIKAKKNRQLKALLNKPYNQEDK